MRALHESHTAERLMPGRLSGRTLDFESGYGRSNRSPAASSLTISKFPFRPMAGRCALNAEIVVRVHGREPELWSLSAGWLTVYQQGRVQLPLAPP